jgi:transposase
MSDHYWITECQLARIKPYFPRSHGRPRVDDCSVISGIIHVIRNGLRWRDAPEVHGSHKTLYNRCRHIDGDSASARYRHTKTAVGRQDQ